MQKKAQIRRNIKMAMNPMQRKIRNSFLFGFLVALILGAVVIGLLIVQNKTISFISQYLENLRDTLLFALGHIHTLHQLQWLHYTFLWERTS